MPADALDSSTNGILAALFSPLVQVSPEGELEPLVADALPSSDDGVTWTVRVADGWTFHNGEPVTGKSFVDGWNFTASTDEYPAGSYSFSAIDGYQAVIERSAASLSGVTLVDPMTIAVRLTKPDAMFGVDLAGLAFAPMSRSCLADPYLCETSPIGNGPFQVTAPWQEYEPLLMQRFERWNGPTASVADRLELHFSAYGPDMLAGVASERYDLASLPGDPPDDTGSVVLTPMPLPSLRMLMFATDDDRFEDQRVRSAFSMAIDRDSIAELASGYAAHGLAPSTVVGHQPNACGPICTYDPVAAKALLDSAGGIAGPVTLTYNGGEQEGAFRLLADQLASNLAIDVTLHDTDDDENQAFGDQPVAEGIYEAGAAAENSTAFELVARWRSDLDQPLTTGNGLGYRNDAVDDLLVRAEAAPSLEQATALTQEAERAVLADMPGVPLWFRAHLLASPTRVQGLVATPDGGPRWELLSPG